MAHSKRFRSARTRPRRQVRRHRIHSSADPFVSVIIPVLNERRTLARVIERAAQVHPASEVIVVANGTTDGSDRIAEKMGARVLRYAIPLGHDKGRSVGAEAAAGRILLFIDGDIVLPAADLRPFVHAVNNGVDVALNNYQGPVRKHDVHGVVLAKHALNAMLSRQDLGGASMTAVPHALSRRALELIGSDAVSVPPLAHTMAVVYGLNIRGVHTIDVGRINRRRVRGLREDPLEPLICQDHMQAIRWLMEQRGPRGGHSDLTRQRERVT
ncbi:glycosyltransferase [Paenibacillus thiaminolyticus]|uniref:Glycosyltransferase n=1 Tax=Paenibacillus thiaminolyticus TaxID=49283 RepID=A0A3A3GFK9_PANTH|nr:glycosyltransferase [Paenibacillus thiaminolyticus]RJG16663.1 glycosyltransferase [Paenibacillus thiaminolyticus]RJG20571.1 glycosyltransferase [Paenibacillus thiaminolyticus]